MKKLGAKGLKGKSFRKQNSRKSLSKQDTGLPKQNTNANISTLFSLRTHDTNDTSLEIDEVKKSPVNLDTPKSPLNLDTLKSPLNLE